MVGSAATVAIAFTPQSDAAHVYYRAMEVAFASVRRWNPGLSLTLVTDVPPPDEFRDVADVLLVPFAHRPPDGFVVERFRASLYMLDALAAVSSTGCDVLFLDPDVLCLGPLDALFDHVGDGVGGYPIPYPARHDINGLSREEAGALHALIGEPVKGVVPVHYGGECYVFRHHRIAPVVERVENAWRFSLDRHAAGLSRFTTEEHLLSYAMRSELVADLSGSIKRIWTASRFRNVDGSEAGMPLWHLPAEKNRGFAALHPVVRDPRSWFWTAHSAEFSARAGRALSVTSRTQGKHIRDLAGQTIQRLKRIVPA